MVRPFRFGVISTNISSREAWVTTAQKAEDLGYSTLLVPDHPLMGLGTITAMASAADATSSLRIGSFVFSNDFHHPALLAKEVATLDRLSGGRIELGIGAGGWQADYTQTGITFDAASTRIRRLEEAVEVIRQYFTEEIVNFSGSFYTITEMQGQPKPVQKPYPPIMIGGTGKQGLSLAGRVADIVHIAFPPFQPLEVTPEMIEQRLAWVREAAGARFANLELGFVALQVNITDGAGSLVEPEAGTGDAQAAEVGGFSHPPSFNRLSGSHEQIIEELLERRELYGFSYIQLHASQMKAFAPVVARLNGK